MLVSARNGIIPKACGFVSSDVFVYLLQTIATARDLERNQEPWVPLTTIDNVAIYVTI